MRKLHPNNVLKLKPDDCSAKETVPAPRWGLLGFSDHRSVINAEASPEGEAVLKIKLDRLTCTTAVISEFERRQDECRGYRQLVIEHFVAVRHGHPLGYENWRLQYVWVDLLVEPLPEGVNTCGDITFTNLKCQRIEESGWFYDQIKEFTESYARNVDINSPSVYRFFRPCLLRAQTYDNQMPGGWKYGTWYGDTTGFGVVGLRTSCPVSVAELWA